mmetsp:Transcript_9052/g.30179  ORF Transcript_9052/g.30179 Transcript_9052/m.30179 type:complete len:371 (-) Transcript_9052:149-1261(-)
MQEIPKIFLLAENHLVEEIDLVGRAEASRGTLIDSLNLDIKAGVASDAIRCLASSLLNEEGEGSDLKCDAKLSRRLGGSGVGKDSHLLGEVLVDVGDKSARVAEGVTLLHPVLHKGIVSSVLLAAAQVGRREDLRVLLDLDLLAGGDPLVASSAGELVHTIIASDEGGGPGSVEHDDGSNLVTAGGAEHASLLVPDADHGSYGPVVVNDGRSIKGVPADGEATVGVGLNENRLLLGSSLLDNLGGLGSIPHDVVGDHINAELNVAEDGVLSVSNSNEVDAESFGDLNSSIQHLPGNLANSLVLHLLVEHFIQGSIAVLGLGAGVEGGVRSTEPLWLRLSVHLGGNHCSMAGDPGRSREGRTSRGGSSKRN